VSTDDAASWAAACAGDGEAFGRVFDEHRNRVFRHALRLVDTVADAEDVTAAAFLELWRRRGDVRIVEGSILPWLLVTTSNVARNLRRSTFRYRRLLDRLPRSEHVLDPADYMDVISPNLASALRRLPTRDLQLVTLVIVEDVSLADAAIVLGISPGAAKVRLHRARTRLRTHLTEMTTVAAGGTR
jgi:RNA polymerase sigma-70 factor (ECF subfamily)